MIELNTQKAIYQPVAIAATKSEIETPLTPAAGITYSEASSSDLGTALGSSLDTASGSEF
jgi:hypothetical protein